MLILDTGMSPGISLERQGLESQLLFSSHLQSCQQCMGVINAEVPLRCGAQNCANSLFSCFWVSVPEQDLRVRLALPTWRCVFKLNYLPRFQQDQIVDEAMCNSSPLVSSIVQQSSTIQQAQNTGLNSYHHKEAREKKNTDKELK